MTECEANLMEATNGQIRAMEASINDVKQSVGKVAEKVDKIGDSLHILARLEERHDHVNTRLMEGARTMGELRERMSEHGRLIEDVRRDMPQLKETRRWVISGILSIVGAVVLALVALVVKS